VYMYVVCTHANMSTDPILSPFWSGAMAAFAAYELATVLLPTATYNQRMRKQQQGWFVWFFITMVKSTGSGGVQPRITENLAGHCCVYLFCMFMNKEMSLRVFMGTATTQATGQINEALRVPYMRWMTYSTWFYLSYMSFYITARSSASPLLLMFSDANILYMINTLYVLHPIFLFIVTVNPQFYNTYGE